MNDNRPSCPETGICGGCAYQGVAYEDQLKNKFGEVRALMENRQIDPEVLLPIEPAPQIYGYRNKMEYTFGDMEKDGPMTLGMHRKKHFMSIVTVDRCQLVHEDFNRVLSATLAFARERGYTHYHKKSHRGLMRNLVLRRGVRTGELLINVVTSTDGEFDETGYVEMIRNLPLEHRIAGILHTLNDRLADAVNCDELRVLDGREYYEEEICGLRFKVGAFSFFQTNVEAVERLYEYAVGLLESEGSTAAGKKIFDLYCGTGTISQVLAKSASEVIGIELVEEAVEGARKSAELNGLDNCTFYAGDVFEVMDSIADRPECIVVDPPRMGMRPDALDNIISYQVDRIVYVSCNPKTLADNLYYLQYNGYQVRSVKPFDNFPWTKHCECCSLMSRVE